MKNKLFIRKDLEIDTNRLARICVTAGFHIADYKADPKIEILETMYLQELHNLEADLIENGMHFQWIEDNGTLVAIIAIEDKDIFFLPKFLEPFKEYTPDIKKSNLKEVHSNYVAKKTKQ